MSLSARIPSALVRAPLPAHEKPAEGWKGGMRSRSTGGFGLAFYSTWRRDFKPHNWTIAALIGSSGDDSTGATRPAR